MHDREELDVKRVPFITPDRIFHLVVSIVTVLLAVIGATMSFSDKANSVVHSIRSDIAAQNVEMAKLTSEQKKMREELDEHKDYTKETTEMRARYHHTSAQLNCALCKGILPNHVYKAPMPRGEYR